MRWHRNPPTEPSRPTIDQRARAFAEAFVADRDRELEIPRLAKVLHLERQGKTWKLTVDGEPFPYFLARQPIVTTTDPDGIGVVMLPLMAERVEIVDALDAE